MKTPKHVCELLHMHPCLGSHVASEPRSFLETAPEAFMLTSWAHKVMHINQLIANHGCRLQYLVVYQCIVAEANATAFYIDGSSMSNAQVTNASHALVTLCSYLSDVSSHLASLACDLCQETSSLFTLLWKLC